MRIRQVSMLVLIVALAVVAVPTVSPARAMQVENSLGLTVWPVYLGPDVVVSGNVSSAAGIPTVTVAVEDLINGGPLLFSGEASVALRPPLGHPAASWRVPLGLADGTYRVTAVSSLAGQTLQQEIADFEVVSATMQPVTLVPADAGWTFYDQGHEPAENPPGVPWHGLGYDAGAWPVGPAELGYGDGDEAGLTQALTVEGDKVLAQYFRHEFVVDDPSDYDSVTMSLHRDDGAIVYLNGVELGRTNMPDGLVGYDTLATSVSEQTVSISLDASQLVPGENLFAIEVHQSSATSSDLSFAATVDAIRSETPKVSNSAEGTYVLAAGDMARCNFDGDEAVADQMAELFDTDRGLFIGLGDLAYERGTIDEFTACYDPTIGQFRDVTWPSPGNHEHLTMPNAAGYRQYFGPAAGPTAGPNGGLWYSFDVDDYWHVIALDSDCAGHEVLPGAVNGDGCAVGSQQEQWLRADLQANQHKNILAFFHHPPFTNNRYTDHEYTWPLWRALSEYGADITLHGHEHHYERYVPLDYWGEPAATNAMTEFIVGSGGTFPRYNLRAQEAESAFRGTFPHGTNDFGVLQLWLRPDGYEWKWESIYGLAATDQGTAGLNAPMPRADMSGRVTDRDTTNPLAAAEVCVTAARTGLRACALTDADGHYEFTEPLVIDNYSISVVGSDGESVQSDPETATFVAGSNVLDLVVTRPSRPQFLTASPATAGDRFGSVMVSFDLQNDGFTDLALLGETGKTGIYAGSSSGLVPLSAASFGPGPGALAAGDFDGSGSDQLAIGSPSASVGGDNSAGIVTVVDVASGVSKRFDGDTAGVPGVAEVGDEFGYALACGDFNDDGYDDLAVGVAGEALGSLAGAGAVIVFYGSAFGLRATGSTWLSSDVPGVPGTAEAGDRFGASLAAGDFDADGFDDLAVGIPDEALGSKQNAGAVTLFSGSSSGLQSSGSKWLSGDTGGVPGAGEVGDRFGTVLAAGDLNSDGFVDLVVGIPNEALGSKQDAGAAIIFNGSAASGIQASGSKWLSGNSPGAPGVGETGDLFGSAFAIGDYDSDGREDLVVGSPGEALGTTTEAGAVLVFHNLGAGVGNDGALWRSGRSAGMPGWGEHGDEFGGSLAMGRFDGVNDGLVIGIPGEAIGSIAGAGAVIELAPINE